MYRYTLLADRFDDIARMRYGRDPMEEVFGACMSCMCCFVMFLLVVIALLVWKLTRRN